VPQSADLTNIVELKNSFSLTTPQAAHLACVEPHVLRTHLQRHGNYKGAVPRKQPNGRLLWPRDQMLKAAGRSADGSLMTTPANAAIYFFEGKNLDMSDPVLHEAVFQLLSKETKPEQHDFGQMLTESAMVGTIVSAFCHRLKGSIGHMTQREFKQCCDHFGEQLETDLYFYLFGLEKLESWKAE
jgi:hypothetical protein